MLFSFRIAPIAAALSFLVACGGPAEPDELGGDMVSDLRPKSLAELKFGWTITDGGIAESRGGLIIDIADMGSISRRALGRVQGEGQVDLVINLDANGDQTLEVRLVTACASEGEGSETRDLIQLKNGYNRVTLSAPYEAHHRCFAVELHAPSGPVSLFIENAMLYWKDTK